MQILNFYCDHIITHRTVTTGRKLYPNDMVLLSDIEQTKNLLEHQYSITNIIIETLFPIIIFMGPYMQNYLLFTYQ